ncbi:MAG: hypothetical protein JJE22_01425 [Bacteroidia bacterium]|nr:hypothetical protein [Bacteroidia bacterium]
MNDLTYLIVLRLIHISCAVFWAGSTIYLASFIGPAVKASGPEGGRFMQQLAKTNKLPLVMTLAATLTVVAGLLLFWELSNGFQSEWMKTKHGMVLSIGGGLAIIAYLEGLFVTRPTVEKINKLGKAIAIAGGSPNEEQMQQLAKLRKKIFSANNFVATLLAITVIAMSLVRYI